MYISVASLKGGVGKSTSAVHLAVYFQQSGPTLLVDGDPNRSATRWAKRGKMPFAIADEKEAAYQARNFQHVIIDTSARPEGVPVNMTKHKTASRAWKAYQAVGEEIVNGRK